MDCPPGQKKSGRCGEVPVSGGSTVVCTKAVKQFWSHDILVKFSLLLLSKTGVHPGSQEEGVPLKDKTQR